MQQPVYIFVHQMNARLNYVFNWVFDEQIQCGWHATKHRDEFMEYQGPKVVYADSYFDTEAICIKPVKLLFETDIKQQVLSINRWKRSTVLFYNQPRAFIPFDLFAAIFYLITRYEEYFDLPKDKHMRFDVQNSVAYNYSFLQQPVVDIWVKELAKMLFKHKFDEVWKKEFKFHPTYDIDLTWKYLHKGLKRTLAGFVKDLITLKLISSMQRVSVLLKLKQDPYYSFNYLERLRKDYNLQPVYFWLLGDYHNYDKNTQWDNAYLQKTIIDLSKHNLIGIHPSYFSHTNTTMVSVEKDRLASIIKKPIEKSRQHFIKFSLPNTYKQLIEVGISDDYSMGYASENGFRAGTSNSFMWFDLKENCQEKLRVHPFAFMDATNKFYKKHNSAEAFMDWENLWYQIKLVDGNCVAIFHNYLLSEDKPFEQKQYERLLKLI